MEVQCTEIIISMLNHKIPSVLDNLKNNDSNFIMQELDKFNLKCNTKWIRQIYEL